MSGSAKKPSCSTAWLPDGRWRQHSRLAKTRSAARISSPTRANGTEGSATFIRFTSPTRITEGIWKISLAVRTCVTTPAMDSEWDEAKRQANTLKHGVDFVDAIEMFAGRFIETEDRRRDYGERGTKRLANWMAGLRKSFTWR